MLARVGREYALACVPAVAYLLSQNIPPHELDPWYLLLVLEKIRPTCAAYALPVLIDFVKKEGTSKVDRQAYSLITSFEKEALEPYHYLLPAL